MGISSLRNFNQQQGAHRWSPDQYRDYLKQQGLDTEEMLKIMQASVSSNRLVNACAGSGKTTTMCHVLNDDYLKGVSRRETVQNGVVVDVPQPVTVWTFLKKAQIDMQDRYENIRSELPREAGLGLLNPRFSTFHSDYYHIIHEYTGKAPNIINEHANTALLKNAMKTLSNKSKVSGVNLIAESSLDFDAWSNLESALFMMRDSRPEELTLRGMQTFIEAYSVMDMEFNEKIRPIFSGEITSENIRQKEQEAAAIVAPITRRILHEWKQNRVRRSKSGRAVKDFHDLQDDVFDLLGAGDISKVDPRFVEFLQQRYKILYIDEFQDISTIQYSITKAIVEIVDGTIMVVGDDDQAIYSWRGGDLSSMTRKAPKDFDMEQFFLSKNWRCPEKILDPARSSIEQNPEGTRVKKKIIAAKPGGEVGFMQFADAEAQSYSLIEPILKDLNKGMRVAVLARKNKTLVLPGLMTLQQLPPNLAVDYVKTSSTRVVRDYEAVSGFIQFLSGATGPSVITDDSIDTLKGLFYYSEIRSLKAELARGKTITDLDLVKTRFVEEDSDKESALKKLIESARKYLADFSNESTYLKEIINDLYVHAKGRKFCHDIVKDVLYFDKWLLNQCIEGASSDSEALQAYQYNLTSVWNRLHQSKEIMPHVAFSTVHSFKGREADSVYLLSDTMDEFDVEESLESIVEMRKVHYIAGTRAKKKMVYCQLESKAPSMFYNEMNPVPQIAEDVDMVF